VNDAPVRLTVNISGGIFTGAGVTDYEFSPSNAGIGFHLLRYSLTNANGCTGTDSLIMEVRGICTGIANTPPGHLVFIYPNPTDGQVILENHFAPSENIRLEVLTAEGKLLMERNILHFGKGSKTVLNLSGYANGMYFLKLIMEDNTMVKRVVLSR